MARRFIKPRLILTALNRITSGGRHAYYETNLGFEVRKPLGQKLGGIVPSTGDIMGRIFG